MEEDARIFEVICVAQSAMNPHRLWAVPPHSVIGPSHVLLHIPSLQVGAEASSDLGTGEMAKVFERH